MPTVNERSTLPHPIAYIPWHFRVARSVLRSCRDVVTGLLLTMFCALILDVLAVRIDLAWLLVLGVSGMRWSGTSRVEIVGLSWTTPLETVLIDRSPFCINILGARTRRSGTSRVKPVVLSWTTLLETVQNRPLSLSGWSPQDLHSSHLTYWGEVHWV